MYRLSFICCPDEYPKTFEQFPNGDLVVQLLSADRSKVLNSFLLCREEVEALVQFLQDQEEK